MKEVNFEELINKAKSYSKNDVPWHHHFLTPKCQFNESEKFQMILENEEANESFACFFNERPMEELKLLDSLFHNRKK